MSNSDKDLDVTVTLASIPQLCFRHFTDLIY